MQTAAVLVASAVTAPLRAGTYPVRPVRIIVGQSPGGQTDTLARIASQFLSRRWPESVVVENYGGAAGVVALRMVANAAPDGHTLLLASNATVLLPVTRPDLGMQDPLRTWTPIGRLARVGYVLAVRAGLEVETIRELVALARRRSEPLSFATVGAGSNASVAAATFARTAGVTVTEVPYKGGAPGLQAVLSGDVDATFCDLSLARPHARRGTLRILGTPSRVRLRFAPDIPTFAEADLADLVVEPWYGLLGPIGLPAPIVAEIGAAQRDLLADPAVQRRFASLGYEAITDTPEAFSTAIRTEATLAAATMTPPAR